MPQSLDLVIDRRVLLDERVRLGNVGLGLVVVVVGHEVFDGVARQQFAEFCCQLRGERLIRLEHQRGTLQLFDEPRGGRALARAGRTHEDHVLLAVTDACRQLTDCFRLIA